MNITDRRNTIRTNPQKNPPQRNISDITQIIVHHSLTTSGDYQAFANYHVGQKGWSCMGYMYVINKDGSIDMCADYTTVTPHVGQHNDYSVGICMVGDFRHENPTQSQYQALLELLYKVQNDIGEKPIYGHSELSGYHWKPCPCIDMDVLRDDYEEGDDTMRFTSSTLEDQVKAYLAQQIDKGNIQEVHMERFENDELTTADLFSIYLIQKEGRLA